MAYITLSITVVDNLFKKHRINIATRAFPGSHKEADITTWLKSVTTEFFEPVTGRADIEPKDVYIAATVDQGGNVKNACGNEGVSCGLPVELCAAHRLNTGIHWSLGIAGSKPSSRNPDGTVKNKECNELLARIAALIGHFSHSSKNNDRFRAIQQAMIDANEEMVVDRVLNPVRRNDTRWSSTFAMFERLLRLEKAISEYMVHFRSEMSRSARGMSVDDWEEVRDIASLLAPLAELTTRMQGGEDSFVGRAAFLANIARQKLGKDVFERRANPDGWLCAMLERIVIEQAGKRSLP